jgi:hypothetical protein
MSEYLIEIIKAGVKRIYAIAGDSLNPNYSVVKSYYNGFM